MGCEDSVVEKVVGGGWWGLMGCEGWVVKRLWVMLDASACHCAGLLLPLLVEVAAAAVGKGCRCWQRLPLPLLARAAAAAVGKGCLCRCWGVAAAAAGLNSSISLV